MNETPRAQPWKNRLLVLGFIVALAMMIWIFANQSRGRSGLMGKGELAPDFNLPLLAGGRVDLKRYRGRQAVVLNFWATTCGPCVAEMPILDKLYRVYRARGLVVLGINTDAPEKSRRSVVKRFVGEHKISFPIALDYFVALPRYRVQNIPYTVLIDRQGRVHDDFEGRRSESFFRKHFDTLVGSK